MNKAFTSLKSVILQGCFITCILLFTSCHTTRQFIDWQVEFKSGITEQEKRKAMTEVNKFILDYLDTAGSISMHNASGVMSAPAPTPVSAADAPAPSPAPSPAPGPGLPVTRYDPCSPLTFSSEDNSTGVRLRVVAGPCRQVPKGSLIVHVGPVILPDPFIHGILRILDLNKNRFNNSPR
ncbi:MAG: hypothetical protein ABI707_08000 [Ferruginibacter sp.]